MAFPGVSGSINYAADSGSVAAGNLYISYISSSDFPLRPPILAYEHVPKSNYNFQKPSTEIITLGTLTVKYFQRVFDAGLSVYCYYTKTSIDATPLSTETSPEYTGEISDHSIVKILEIY